MLNPDNQLKFPEGSETASITIKSAGMEALNFGNKYVVHIEPMKGCDHFIPADGLIKKMKDENVDIGDKIVIKKANKSAEWPYGYFNVEMVEKSKSKNGSDPVEKKEVSSLEKQLEVTEIKLEEHELSLRVEKLEGFVNILWKDYGIRTSDAGDKPGDDDIPF